MRHHRRLGALLVALAFPFATRAAPPSPFAPPTTERLLYRRATLIDGRAGPPRLAMDALVAGERIVRVFPDAEVDDQTFATAPHELGAPAPPAVREGHARHGHH